MKQRNWARGFQEESSLGKGTGTGQNVETRNSSIDLNIKV
jgi:hypothetical protein